jgi:hypothetical protein
METLADFLAATNLVAVVNDNDWVWPVCEMLHFVGMALLIGTVGLVDLRILGVGKGLPIATLEKLVPWGVAGFVINATTGIMFIGGNPVGGPIEYLMNLSFQIKMLLVLIAGINLAVFYFAGIARDLESVAPGGDAARSAKIVAVISLVAWFGVIGFGRLIMYNDTLLYAFGL